MLATVRENDKGKGRGIMASIVTRNLFYVMPFSVRCYIKSSTNYDQIVFYITSKKHGITLLSTTFLTAVY